MTFQVARESRVKLMTTMDITEGGADLSVASQSRQLARDSSLSLSLCLHTHTHSWNIMRRATDRRSETMGHNQRVCGGAFDWCRAQLIRGRAGILVFTRPHLGTHGCVSCRTNYPSNDTESSLICRRRRWTICDPSVLIKKILNQATQWRPYCALNLLKLKRVRFD